MNGAVKYIRLEENFRLPSPDDLDDSIAGIDSDIKQEGSAAAFMTMIRDGRKSWESMENRVLAPLAQFAIHYVDLLSDMGTIHDTTPVARAVTKGMLFGHIVNEGVYPRLLEVQPYSVIGSINLKFFADPDAFLKMWEADSIRARQVGAQAMSALLLDTLNAQSLETLQDWSVSTVGSAHAEYFNFGFGTSLYLTRDAYSDMLLADGKKEQVMQYVSDNFTLK